MVRQHTYIVDFFISTYSMRHERGRRLQTSSDRIILKCEEGAAPMSNNSLVVSLFYNFLPIEILSQRSEQQCFADHIAVVNGHRSSRFIGCIKENKWNQSYLRWIVIVIAQQEQGSPLSIQESWARFELVKAVEPTDRNLNLIFVTSGVYFDQNLVFHLFRSSKFSGADLAFKES